MDENNVLGNVVGSLIDQNRDGFGHGGGFMWFILLLFLTGGGFGWGNRGNVATQQDVTMANQFTQIDGGIRGLAAGQANIAYDNLKQSADSNMMVAGGFANLTQALAENRFAQQNCCCDLSRNIDGVKYEMAQQTQTITMNDQMNTQKILDKLCMMEANAKDARIQQLTSDLQAAQLTLAQGVQTQNIIGALRPYPVPAYPVTSPYVGINYGTTFA